MNTKTVFLSTLFPNELYSTVLENSKNTMSDAANALQWHIYEGLCNNNINNIDIVNVLPIGSFPQYYKKAFIKKSNFITHYGVKNVNIGFCNVKLIRKYIIPCNLYRELKFSFEGYDEGIIYIYTISAQMIGAVNLFKKKKPNIKVCAIIADLPNMVNLSVNTSRLNYFYTNHLAKKSIRLMKCIDAYVLLTKYMAEYLKIEKPYCVMEGIATIGEENNCDRNNEKVDFEKKVIMYTGTLHKKFGIVNLVRAFVKIKNPNYRLIICGTGDSEELIKRYSLKDNRICFLGQLPRNEVLEYQKCATVLVNPRQNIEEFTKYSFPSKNMEYLSIGKPVVAYKLDGIPDEYDNYILYVNNNTIESLKDKIVEVCELSEEERYKIGNRGREFVINEKNSISQTKKMIELMKTL